MCRQSITGMLLASGLPISSGASPFDFLQSFRCAPTSSPTPNTPLQPSLAPPCIFGRQTGFEGPAVSAAPPRGQAPPGAERGLAHPFICHLCAPLRASRNQCLLEASTGHARRPRPRGCCVWREDREGLQGSGGKAPHQGSWGGSAEAVKILPHRRGEKQRLQRRHRRNWRRTGPTR